MPKAKRSGGGRKSNLTEMQIALAHREHLLGASWGDLGKRYPTEWRNFYLLFRNRAYPIVERRSGSVPLAQTIVVPTDPAVLAYIAAMIDGEGQISYSRVRASGGRVGWRLGINNTSTALMAWLQAAVPGSTQIRRRFRTIEKWPGERLPCYEWRVTRMRDLAALLRAVEPFLVIKRDRALQAIRESEERIALAAREPDAALIAQADRRIEWLGTLSSPEARKILIQRAKVQAA